MTSGPFLINVRVKKYNNNIAFTLQIFLLKHMKNIKTYLNIFKTYVFQISDALRIFLRGFEMMASLKILKGR